MAGKSYTNLSAIIVTKLGEILGADSNPLFGAIYTIAETEPSSYPCAFVLIDESEGSILDTHRNQREWKFKVVAYQAIGARTPEQAETAMIELIDAVITKFDQDPMLRDAGGDAQCLRSKVVPGKHGFTSENQTYSAVEFTIAVVDVVNNYP